MSSAFMLIPWWPWAVFAALALLAVALSLTGRVLDRDRVDQWVFAHRDHLPIPFVVIGVAARLLARGEAPGPHPGLLVGLGVLLILAGEALRIWAVGIVGAATRSRATNAKRLVQEGPYAIIRNPIYVGNFLLCLGLACLTRSWAAAAACTGYFVIVYHRVIRTEERFLRATFGEPYEEFCRRVPQLLPWRGWSRPLCAPFSFKELRKEYQTAAGIAAMAVVIYLLNAHPWRGGSAGRTPQPPPAAAPQEESAQPAPRLMRTITLQDALRGASESAVDADGEPVGVSVVREC